MKEEIDVVDVRVGDVVIDCAKSYPVLDVTRWPDKSCGDQVGLRLLSCRGEVFITHLWHRSRVFVVRTP